METSERIERLPIVGGTLAFDFLNTQGGSPKGSPDDEVLHDYRDLVAWARHVGTLTEAEARGLLRRAGRETRGARETFGRALGLRQHLYQLFRAVITGRRLPGASTAALRSLEAEALASAELVKVADGYAWSWAHDDELTRPLWPVVDSAVELLTTGPLDRVKQCAGCRWWFLDESKNRSRRWCSMDDCGTAEKMRRYVARRAASRRKQSGSA